nr:ethylene-responsive transcription factor ERF084-like [Aegilops tauschii subsp. strangulata]
MPPRRRGALGYRGVHVRPSGTYFAEIRSGDVRLGLGTFDTAQEGARAYNTAAWRPRRSRWDMNFPDMFFAERRVEREERREERADYREDRRTRKAVAKFNIALGDASSWDSNNERFLNAYAQTSEEDITEAESESEDDE